MATVTAPNRSIIGWLLVAGGVLQVVGAVVHFANDGNFGAIYAISNIAIGVAFVLMIAWIAVTTVSRIAYFVAAVGWLLLALTSLIDLGLIGQVGLYLAIIGSVFSGVIVLSTRPFSQRSDIIFFVALVLGAIDLLLSQNSNVPSIVEFVVVIVFGVALAAAGILMVRRR
ncbi:MAG TPA: hypothetical protein VHZ81_14435 [Galbitalea sp.]|jgi:hypothetical protein|nr:hypothetical protein [Galbitalea sp.]